MIKGFSTRKIESKKTLSELLKSLRLAKGVTLAEAEVGSKVRIKYLAAIEEGKWETLPSMVYVRGFVLAYAKYLEYDKAKILQLFEAEKGIIRNQGKSEISYKIKQKDIRFIITPKVIGVCVLSVLIVAMFGYIIYQVIGFAGAPELQVASPGNNAVVETSAIDINGVTDTNSYLTINDQSVPITNMGHFDTNLKLHQGVNVIKVRVENKVKKETTQVLTVEYKPKTAEAVDLLTNQ